jgi:hypothetical protein
MHEAKFTLSLPPSVNEAYADVIKRSKYGFYTVRIATKVLKAFKSIAYGELHTQKVPHPIWQQSKSIGYEATFYMRTRGSDASNRIKVLEDSIAETLGFNDNRIYAGHFYKRIDKDHPRVEMRLFTLEETP